VPHLNKLHSQYGERGLVVVAVSNENAATVEPWLQRNGVRYGNALSQSAGRSDGVRGIPHAFLISPDGVIQWRGHPQALGEQDIEAVLSGAPMAAAAPGGSQVAGLSRSQLMILIFIVLLVFFVGAVGWYWHSSREQIPPHLKPGYIPPPQYGPPSNEQPYSPQQGGPPPDDNRPPWER
jgi:hypothetical protein